jgi:branched-chain amino acid transport system permease protein
MTAGMAGATGALSAAYMLFVAPATYNLDLAVLTAACVALGGPGNVLGSTIAAVIIGGLRPLLENIGGLSSEASVPWQAVIFGCMLVLGIRFRPQGLVPERGTGLFRTTLRERISVPQQEARPIEVEAVGQRPPSVREKAVIEFPPRQFARAMRPAGGIAEFPPGEPAEERKIPIVEVRGISKRFGGLQAVDDFSLDLHAGEVVALIGPNGAGKTTVFDLLTARLRPDTGDARLRGKSIVNMSARAIARSGMVRYFQNVRVFGGLTALENVAMGIPRQPGESLARTLTMPLGVWCHERQVREQAIEHLEYVGAADLRNNLVRDLAFGQQKLVAFARLLATGGNVLLLDEPAAGVDPRSAEQIIELVRSLAVARKAICIVEHSVYVVSELANRVIFMDNGRIIAEGTVGEVTSRHDLIDLYFGT